MLEFAARLTSSQAILMVNLHLYVNKHPVFKQWSLYTHEEKTKPDVSLECKQLSHLTFPNGFNGDTENCNT